MGRGGGIFYDGNGYNIIIVRFNSRVEISLYRVDSLINLLAMLSKIKML